MKTIITVTALCFAGSVFAQTANVPADTGSQNKNGKMVELVGIDQMPLPLPPGETEKMRRSSQTVAPTE